MKFQLDSKKIPNGAVLIFYIRYDRALDDPDETRGRTNPKIYTYAMLKAGGLWYVTGSGRVPTAAGWGAVQRWLERDGRTVVRVDLMGAPLKIWPPDSAEAAAPDPAS